MFKPLDPLLHSELRLAVMSILMTVAGATAGNLSVQIDKLEKAGYLSVQKTFCGKRPRTICAATAKGREAFALYVEALKSYTSFVQ